MRTPALAGTNEQGFSEHNARCTAGVARTSLRVGDFRRGISIAGSEEADDKLRIQSADILMGMKVGSFILSSSFFYSKNSFILKFFILSCNWADFLF